MIFENILNNRKIIFILLIIGIANVFFIYFFYSDHFYRGDTQSYVETAKWLGGDKNAQVYPYRLLKPLGLLLPALFEKFNLGGEFGLQFQNLILYFLSIILIFDLILYFYKDKFQALLGAILFLTAWPFLTNAISYLTDMAGWFFYVLSIWLILKLHQVKEINPKFSFLLGLVGGVGFLFKESAIASLFFYFGYLFFINESEFKEKVKLFVVYCLGAFLPVLISSVIIFMITGYTFWDWFRSNWAGRDYYNLTDILLNGILTFMLGWLFLALGIFKEFKEKNKQRLKWFLAFLLPSLNWAFWSFPAARIMYVAFPLLVFWGSNGLVFIKEKIGNFFLALFLSVYVILNFFLSQIINYHQIRSIFNLIF